MRPRHVTPNPVCRSGRVVGHAGYHFDARLCHNPPTWLSPTKVTSPMTNENQATFIDFDVRIFKAGDDGYTVTAQTPGSGLAEDTLDWAVLSHADFQAKLEQIREEPFTANEAFFREVGSVLFESLFRGEIRDLFLGVYQHQVLADDHTYLRLRLNVSRTAPEVATLPWELMNWNDAFLATHTRTLLTRNYLEFTIGPVQSQEVRGLPKVLVVIPRGSGLAVAEERATITQALEEKQIPYEVLGDDRVSIETLRQKLEDDTFHIVHFIGHGEFEEDAEGAMHGLLRFNATWDEPNEEEDEEWVSGERLQALLQNHPSVKLVVLNACKGAEIAERRNGRGFVGVAPSLLKARVPAVVAMQYSIRDDVALVFARAFYESLTGDLWGGHVDIATALARNACYLNFPNDRGFATPILYLRAEGGKIFDLKAETEAPARPTPPPADECQEPPKPDEAILYKYRFDSADQLALTAKAKQGNVDVIRAEIQRLERMQLENPIMAEASRADVRIPQLQAQLDETVAELDELIQVVRWKTYELCLEVAQARRELEAMKARKAELEQEGKPVPHALMGDIQRQNDELIRMQIKLDKAMSAL
ncbi:MAG: CHAT domain-containing protein [Chloroflexi bacterium]|nr:MAG: CHAT domain-containing protein [Chloroflexota bacterium]